LAIRKSDYENYDYREFWESGKRIYEDKSERLALRKFLGGAKKNNKLFLDIGCGYGRLFNEYKNFKNIVLVDYSLRNLKAARDSISNFLKFDENKLSSIYFVAADASCLPFKSGCADIILTVRVVHHLNYPEKYFDEVSRILKNEGLYFLEFANKRNLKNILKYAVGRMDTSPFNMTPSQIGKTILNFHPKCIIDLLKKRGFNVREMVSVSNFRLGFLKNNISVNILLFFERAYQKFFSSVPFGPSVFLNSILEREKDGAVKAALSSNHRSIPKNSGKTSRSPEKGNKINLEDILICPHCKKDNLAFGKNKIFCDGCSRTFQIENGIYNFKV
jgi:ubiquinone/menaquinone biosynthesis C-methylase UbiE